MTNFSAKTSAKSDFCVAALYHFTPFPRFEEFQPELRDLCLRVGTTGTLLLAHEGINGTIAGTDAAIHEVLEFLHTQPEFGSLEHKESRAEKNPFLRMKVRLKKEIVTMGVPDIDPLKAVGTYVAPENWNELISDPDTLVIDTRNDYEVAIGTFENAVNPNTVTFREFPDWVRANKDKIDKPKIAMFCTGGIRCEKATAFMKSEGYEDVFHLKGGILKYLETIPEEESKWEGACFVFDERVSILHGLKEGEHSLCRACRHPLTQEEVALPEYEDGVSCVYCIEQRSEDDRARFRQRQLQLELAKKRGTRHFGT